MLMVAGSRINNNGKVTMINKLLGTAAMAAVALAVVPANAATTGGACSGANLGKTESAIETRADGDGKWAPRRRWRPLRTRCSMARWGRAARISTRPYAPRRQSSLAERGRLHCDRPNAFLKPDLKHDPKKMDTGFPSANKRKKRLRGKIRLNYLKRDGD